MDIENIVVLTGAGISAESGLATFRGGDGLWCGHRIEEVATPEGYAANPALVQQFYNERRRQLTEVEPNAAHHALAKLAAEWKGNFLLVTQNVDDLHDRALAAAGILPSPRSRGEQEGGARAASPVSSTPHALPLLAPPASGRGMFDFIHMHGELTKARCTRTGAISDCRRDLAAEEALRPHIVWFGEMPLDMEKIDRALRQADLFVAIGTSGNVYPAAGFVMQAQFTGAHTIELNLEPSLVRSHFAEARHGKASELVPQWVDELLA